MAAYAHSPKALQLIAAVGRSDLPAVQRLLGEGKRNGTLGALIAANGVGNTLLITAAKRGFSEVCSALIEAGVDVNAKDKFGMTAYIAACCHYRADTCDVLIAAGADVDVTIPDTNDGSGDGYYEDHTVEEGSGGYYHCCPGVCSQLRAAVTCGDVKKCKRLISLGANVNPSCCGPPPIVLAVANGHAEVCKVLIAAGAHVEMIINDETEETLLDLAQQNGYQAVCKVLLDADKRKFFYCKPTVLAWAAGCGFTQLCMARIARGDRVNADGRVGESYRPALYNAAWKGFVDTCNVLIAAGANVNHVDREYGDTALHAANNPDTCDALIAAGANINAAAKNGYTPLISAVFRRKVDNCKALIAAGADVHARAFDGRTALDMAADMGNTDICEALIAAGATYLSDRPVLPRVPTWFQRFH